VALLSASLKVEKLIQTLKGDEKTGAQIVLRCLEEPIRQIAQNAGVDGGVVVYNVLKADQKNYGYDALADKYVNMIEAGIVDPTKVVRSEIQNASSVASTLLTTECLVAEIPEKKDSGNSGVGNINPDMY
jgi:chaperonin GroEL